MFEKMGRIFAIPMDDGYGGIEYDLTAAGYVAFVIGMLAVLLLAVAITNRITGKKSKVGIRQLSFSAMAIALATVASMIPMPRMPMGGYITLCSLLIIALIGYWFGLAGGIACGVAYGTLQMLIDPYILSVPQLLCDYIFAFGALGLSGLFPMKKGFSPVPGYIAAVCGRYIFAVLSGVIFFAAYAPAEGILSNAWLYSLAYNGVYIGTELLLTLVILRIPAFRKALSDVGYTAMAENRISYGEANA